MRSFVLEGRTILSFSESWSHSPPVVYIDVFRVASSRSLLLRHPFTWGDNRLS